MSEVSGYVDPLTWAGQVAVLDGPGIELLPRRCLICGTEDGLRAVRHDYQDAPLTALVRERERVMLTLCGRCERRWIFSDRVYLATVGVGLLVFPLGMGLWAERLGVEHVGLFGTWVGFLVWLLLVVLVRIILVLPRQILCVRLLKGTLSLSFPRPELTREILTEAKRIQDSS